MLYFFFKSIFCVIFYKEILFSLCEKQTLLSPDFHKWEKEETKKNHLQNVKDL